MKKNNQTVVKKPKKQHLSSKKVGKWDSGKYFGSKERADYDGHW